MPPPLQQQQPAQQNYVEYKLKATCLSSFSHHLMTLSTNANSIASFAPPVRMYRDESTTSPMALDGPSPLEQQQHQEEGPQLGRFGFPSKRRSKVLSQDIEFEKKQTALLGPDVHPWVIEDGDGEHSLIGKREGGQQSHYVFFVNQGNSFLIVPVTHWYRFAPKPTAPQMTLEEAEALMAGPKKKKGPPAKIKSPNSVAALAGDEEGDAPSETGKNILEQIKRGIQEENPPQGSLTAMRAALGRETPLSGGTAAATADPFRHAEELDYDEVFEDDEEVGFDEETMYGESDDPSAPVPVRANRTASSRFSSLSTAGKDLRRIVQSHDKGVVEEDSEDEDEFDSQKPSPIPPTIPPIPPTSLSQQQHQGQPPTSQRPQPTFVVPSHQSAKSNNSISSGLKRPHHSSQSPPQSPSSSPPPTPSQQPSALISEQSIIAVLRKGPIKTKDIISHFRHELKDPEKKNLFRDVVKRVATVHASSAASGASENEKLLVLKPEFK